ncbi:MAG TPA: hypothetical protein DCY79_23880 [Planctomycetaceae bacterium]|nr:hypothetical protein [Blastopirellula sp.]HAY82860.1 hypothetical protein [Planctomycetaceae bacterium]|tara:strand:- start:110 stop:313 length:204 start_codon:yes stop_codon:yes gene_type:complete
MPNTKRNYEVTRKHLIDHFGRERMLAEISPGDADEWRESLRTQLLRIIKKAGVNPWPKLFHNLRASR